MGHQRHSVRLSVRRGGLCPPVVLAEGENGLDPHQERGCGGVQFPWQLQFLLDEVPGAEVSGQFGQDGDEKTVPGSDHSGALGYQRLLHRSVGSAGSGQLPAACQWLTGEQITYLSMCNLTHVLSVLFSGGAEISSCSLSRQTNLDWQRSRERRGFLLGVEMLPADKARHMTSSVLSLVCVIHLW